VEETWNEVLEVRPGKALRVVGADDDDSADDDTAEEGDDRRKGTTNDVSENGLHPVVEGVHEDDIQTNDCDHNVGDSLACYTVRNVHATVDGKESDDDAAEDRIQDYPNRTVVGHLPRS
jgi:hypothetical protein